MSSVCSTLVFGDRTRGEVADIGWAVSGGRPGSDRPRAHRDLRLAAVYFRRAADAGHVAARCNLGVLLAQRLRPCRRPKFAARRRMSTHIAAQVRPGRSAAKRASAGRLCSRGRCAAAGRGPACRRVRRHAGACEDVAVLLAARSGSVECSLRATPPRPSRSRWPAEDSPMRLAPTPPRPGPTSRTRRGSASRQPPPRATATPPTTAACCVAAAERRRWSLRSARGAPCIAVLGALGIAHILPQVGDMIDAWGRRRTLGQHRPRDVVLPLRRNRPRQVRFLMSDGAAA